MTHHPPFNARCIAFFLFFTFTFNTPSFTQAPYWTITDQSRSTTSDGIVLNLDFNALKSQLIKGQSTVLLPMPDATFASWQITENSVMHPDLAKRYPNLKSYSGFRISQPAAKVCFSVTEKGLQATITEPRKSAVYIDPIDQSANQYRIHSASKNGQKSSWSCQAEQIAEEIETNQTANKALAADCTLRTYQFALACTGEYAAFHGGTKASVMSAYVTSLTRINGILESDLSLRLVLVPNTDTLIFLNSSTDPYTNGDGLLMMTENQTAIDTRIGSANYDLGHVFGTGNSGVAFIKIACFDNFKARGVSCWTSPVGDNYDVDMVAHEIGHQLGANHSMNNNCNRRIISAAEPGSGSTIMSYSGICAPNVQTQSDAYFHAISLAEIRNFITNFGNTCATTQTLNTAPSVNAGLDQTVPIGTPIVLAGSATDPEDATLYYNWEQMDTIPNTQPPVSTNTGGPQFRSFTPTTDPKRYLPSLSNILAGTTPTWEVLPSVARTMRFRLIARDMHTGGGCFDSDEMIITVTPAAGPFRMTSNNTNDTLQGGAMHTITWDVANTNQAPINASTVDILLSNDGGMTYPTILASATPNDGSQAVLLPSNGAGQARLMVKATNSAFFDVNDLTFAYRPGTGLTITDSIVQAKCGDANGAIFLTPTNGVPTYTYTWAHGPATSSISGLSAGTYAVTVVDQNGLSFDTSYTITNTLAPEINQVQIYDNSGTSNDTTACHDIPINFGAFATFGTGTGPLTWTWSVNAANATFVGNTNEQFAGVTFTNTTSSTINVPVQILLVDNLGCKDSVITIIAVRPLITIDTIYRIEQSGSPNDGGVCFGDSITFDVEVTPNSTYTYSWSNGATGNPIVLQPPFNLISTLYSLTVTDNAGCAAQSLSSAKGIPELIASSTYIDACPSTALDTIRYTVSGGGQFPGNQYLFIINTLSAAEFHSSVWDYTFSLAQNTVISAEIRDEKGCRLTLNDTIPASTCNPPCVPQTYDLCPGETYTLSADAGSASNIQWYKDQTLIPGETGSTLIVGQIGQYFYTAHDINGCPVQTCCPVSFIVPSSCPANCPTKVCLPIQIVRN